MGDATEAILGATVLSVDRTASAAYGFIVAIPMGDATEA
jgi:undecaprenyl pyrophosphate phosphatase UppP